MSKVEFVWHDHEAYKVKFDARQFARYTKTLLVIGPLNQKNRLNQSSKTSFTLWEERIPGEGYMRPRHQYAWR